jgi:hypothetical protein
MSSYICEDLLGNEKQSLFRFFFFGGFFTHCTTIVSKTTALSNVKKRTTKGVQSLLTLVLQGTEGALFFTTMP